MMTKRAGRWIDRNLGWITLVCVIGTCVCFVGLGILQSQVRSNAKDGAKALARSCRLAVVSKKVYVDNLQRGVITQKDLDLFTGTLQQACTRR